MKNITVSVPDEVYRSARIHAALHGTSVSALVADYLDTITRRAAEFERLAEQQRHIAGQIGEFRATDRLDRDELHDRALR